MAGIKQFNEQDVLDKACELFWRNGYESSSIQDLVLATGLNRGSLYSSFGDKETLFLRVLSHYQEKIVLGLSQTLEDENPLTGLETFFETIAERMSKLEFPPGCLYTNTACEAMTLPQRVSRLISANMGQFEALIYQSLQRADRLNLLRDQLDLRAQARFLTAITQGMAVLNRTQPDPSILDDIVRVAQAHLQSLTQ